MKTSFGRQFLLTALLFLVCILTLTLAFRGYLMHDFVEKLCAPLEENARGIAQLASPYNDPLNLSGSWDMRINLYISAGIAGDDTQFLICDKADNGDRIQLPISMCSCSSFYCNHLGQELADDKNGYIAHAIEQIDQQLCDGTDEYPVFSGITTIFSELNMEEAQPMEASDETASVQRAPMEKLLNKALPEEAHPQQTQYLAAIAPIYTLDARKMVFAYAVAYKKYDPTFINQTNHFIKFLVIAVSLLALFLLPLLIRSQNQPLRDMAATVRRFGHGELDVRIPVGGNNTEEIDELAVAFNNMAVSLEQSELRRREFVANISHELKTPMTTIAGFMDGMLDGTIPPERHREYMQTVSNEVRRLSRLVRSMLEISRLQSQGIPDEHKQIFDISEQAGQTLFNFEKKINDRGIHVTVDFPESPVEVFAEKDSITQVIYNLIDNAVKFCNPGGELRLKIALATTRALVSVSNTGGTIPENELPRIFERFHKTDKSRSSNRDGVGLGLYIVRTIILSHGEDITVTSRDGLTTFTFTLALPA